MGGRAQGFHCARRALQFGSKAIEALWSEGCIQLAARGPQDGLLAQGQRLQPLATTRGRC
eukprot:9064134-Lingulodinium_polyedra.AAC.1